MKLIPYIKGLRRGREANAIEREALRDPFLSDALEGFDEVAGDHGEAIERLQARVAQRTRRRGLAPAARNWAIAASLLLCVALGGYFWSIREKPAPATLAGDAEGKKTPPEIQTDMAFDLGAAMLEEEKIRAAKDTAPAKSEGTAITTVQDTTAPTPETAGKTAGKPSVAVVSDIISIVKDDTKVTTSLDYTEFNEEITVEAAKAEVKTEVVVADDPFIIVENMPTFRGGGLNVFRDWVQERLKYPEIAAENGISGRVTVSFVIEKDGTLTNIEVLQTPDKVLSDEAVRVLQTSPRWVPGKQRNIPVRVKYTLPVDFRIQQ